MKTQMKIAFGAIALVLINLLLFDAVYEIFGWQFDQQAVRNSLLIMIVFALFRIEVLLEKLLKHYSERSQNSESYQSHEV